MRSKVSLTLMGLVLATGLTACGGSSGGSDEFPAAYVQFYNGSANSAQTVMRSTETSTILAGASFGDATSLISVEAGLTEIEFYRTDSDDQEVIIDTQEFDLDEANKTLIMLTGDFSAPTFNEYKFKREELEGEFRLFAVSVLADSAGYDLYMSDSGAPFSEANLLGTIEYENFEELEYWDDTFENFDQGDYTLYLTAPGSSDVLFESNTISFGFATEYVLVLRGSTGAIQDGLEVDMVLNSSSVANFDDVNASAQFRVYNSLDSHTIDLALEGNDDTNPSLELAANTVSDFTEVEFGDYRLTATSQSDAAVRFNNRLVTLNQGASKAIVIYEDAEQQLTSLSFNESTQPQVFDKQVSAANLVSDFSDIDLYFVRKDETIESAQYLISSLDFGESKTLTLPSDFYELVAVFDDNEDTQILLDRTQLIGFDEDANYIVTIEESIDAPTGYKISVVF